VQPLGTELIRLVEAIPSFVQSLQERLAAAQIFLKNNAMAGQLASTLANAAGGVVAGVGQRLLGGPALVAGMIGNAVLIVLLAVGWMLSADELAQFTLSLLPAAPREDWRKALQEIGTRLTAYVAGIVINGALVGAAMGLSLALLGIPFALLLAVVVAVFQAIPMVGAIISGPIVLVIVLATSGWTKMLVVLAIFAIVQIVDQNVVSPIIFGQRVQLSFLLIIFATIVGGTLLGIGGAFLAVPAAAVLQVIVVRIGAPAIRRAGAIAVTESAE
ncbi:MAG TPA: AI-2E family transporter, partial [Candidatus Binatia bacterium]|nr:AI-2E family transporter [Candidatus Binatia bacterium]